MKSDENEIENEIEKEITNTTEPIEDIIQSDENNGDLDQTDPEIDTESDDEQAKDVDDDESENAEQTDESCDTHDTDQQPDVDDTDPAESNDQLTDTDPDPDDDDPSANDIEAAVEFEGDRPIVRELEYQTPRGSKLNEEDDEIQNPRFGSITEAKAVVEGFLFSCNEPLTVTKLSRLMSNLHPKSVRGLLLELQWEYQNRSGALQVIEIAGGYQLCTRPHVAPWMFRLHKHKRRSALSPATLETLAIIAYRQPITKGEIETIRGVESGAPLRTLQELSMIEASGRREVIGRPQLYISTEQFLKAFGLKSLGDLPSISELKSRFAEETRLKSAEAAPTPKAPEPEPEPEIPNELESENDGGVDSEHNPLLESEIELDAGTELDEDFEANLEKEEEPMSNDNNQATPVTEETEETEEKPKHNPHAFEDEQSMDPIPTPEVSDDSEKSDD